MSTTLPHIIERGCYYRGEMINLSDVNGLYRDKPKHPKKKLKLTLPMPPSINHMYYNTKGGGRRLTRSAEIYVANARAIINEAIEDQKWKLQKNSIWFYVDITFFMPDRRKRDSHNTLKILLDVMEGIVYINDYYAIPRIQSVEYDKENPRLEIVVSHQSTNDRVKAYKLVGIL